MWLVLCESNDLSALWAYQGLKARGLEPLELITAEMLAYSLRWEHQVGKEGVNIDITLADGRTICGNKTVGVLNRLLSLPSDHLETVNQADRNYAIQEITALAMSWLYALPVLNRPNSQGLSGQWRHISEWVWLAAKAGLPTPRYKQTSHERTQLMGTQKKLFPVGTPVNTVIVIGGHVISASAPPKIVKGCQSLAKLADTPLLGIEFAQGASSIWTFAGATPLPDLRLGGSVLLDVLASVLQRKDGERE